MKKYVSLILGLSIILFVSCNDDDDKDNLFDALVGTWEFTSEVVINCDDSTQDFTETCTADCPTLTISADKTYVFSDGMETDTGTISNVTATSVTICGDTETDCGPLSYTLIGDTWTVVDNDPPADSAGCLDTIIFKKIS